MDMDREKEWEFDRGYFHGQLDYRCVKWSLLLIAFCAGATCATFYMRYLS